MNNYVFFIERVNDLVSNEALDLLVEYNQNFQLLNRVMEQGSLHFRSLLEYILLNGKIPVILSCSQDVILDFELPQGCIPIKENILSELAKLLNVKLNEEQELVQMFVNFGVRGMLQRKISPAKVHELMQRHYRIKNYDCDDLAVASLNLTKTKNLLIYEGSSCPQIEAVLNAASFESFRDGKDYQVMIIKNHTHLRYWMLFFGPEKIQRRLSEISFGEKDRKNVAKDCWAGFFPKSRQKVVTDRLEKLCDLYALSPEKV